MGLRPVLLEAHAGEDGSETFLIVERIGDCLNCRTGRRHFLFVGRVGDPSYENRYG